MQLSSSMYPITEDPELEEWDMDHKEKTKTEKSTENLVRISESDSRDAERGSGEPRVVANMEEIALKALHIDDDPTLNPWTFRMFLIGEYFCLDLGDSV